MRVPGTRSWSIRGEGSGQREVGERFHERVEKSPAIINLRGRVEGYVRSPPLENSSWPAGLKSHPLPYLVKSRERNPPPRLPLTSRRTNLLFFPGKNDGHIVKSFYVVNFTRHGHTSYYTRNQKRSVSILSNDRYLPILEFQIIRATFSLFFFFQFIVLFLKIFLYKLQNEGSIATSPLRDPSHSPNSKLPPFISSKHFLFFFSSISTLLARFKILQNPWKSFDANSINRARSFINPRNYPFNRVATGSPQGGCVRSLEAQTASRLAARDRVDKKQPGLEKGVRGRREYYADPPRWGWKPAELLLSGSEWGPKRARSGQNNVKSALPTPGRNFRSPLLPRLALLLHPLLRQHRYPTTSLKYLSSPGGLTLVKWYRDTWTVGLLIFRSKPLENSPSSRLKYRPK